VKRETVKPRIICQLCSCPKEVRCGTTNRICSKLRTRTEKFANDHSRRSPLRVFGGKTKTGKDSVGPPERQRTGATGAARSSLHVKGESPATGLYMEEQFEGLVISMSGS